jgi:hypothetical protein
LWIGLLFVLAAGFAREYDGEDLLREPWHLLIPLGASLASSALLYLLVRLVARLRGSREPAMWQGYVDFLSLYWMTAPLALLYAIPFERFLWAGGAVEANLWLLGIVAAWRVVLMSRVLSVIYRAPFWECFLVVMFFADTLLVIILAATPLPIVGIMGGIRLSEAEQVLFNVGWMLRVLGVLSWPIWLIGLWLAAGLPILFPRSSGRLEWRYLPIEGGGAGTNQSTFAAAIGSLAVWIVILPLTQPEQQRRGRVERDLKAGRIHLALEFMSAHERSDFPPHWDPPPRVAYRERRPDITEVQEHLDVLAVKPWVREIYVEKFGNWLAGDNIFEGALAGLPPDQVERRIELIERMPERAQVVRDNEGSLQRMASEYSELPADLKKRIGKLLDQAGLTPPAAAQSESPAPSTSSTGS